MHVFLSDLHLTDSDLGSPVVDAELKSFCEVTLASYCMQAMQRKRIVTLVLLGDVVELLRSKKWAKLWADRQAAPWIGADVDF